MEQRRTRRFKLQLPMAITRSGSEPMALAGLTRNISSNGVLFSAEREPDIGNPIEYIITLNREGLNAVNLRCVGKIVRSEREPLDASYQVAATLERYEFVRQG